MNYTGVAFVSVEYRKAPEHKYPVPIEDSIAAVNFIVDNEKKYGFTLI